MPPTTLRRFFPLLMIGTLLLALLPWAVSVLRTPPPSDLIWLYEGFARLINGQSMKDSIFEPNPPLSLFTYALPYFMTQLTGWSPATSIFVYVMSMLALGAFVVKYVATRILHGGSYAPWLLTLTYVVSQSIMTASMYGERDHLIAIMLVPFVLMQYALLKGKTLPPLLQWLVFPLGALVILLKPHHGLIPFLMIVWRVLQRKDASFLKEADFLSLSAMVLGYMALLFWGFSDYRTIIFPDVVVLYLANRVDNILSLTALLAAPGIVLWGVTCVLRHRIHYSALILFLSLCALASLVPYLVQGKGFSYHLFPAFGFFVPAFFLLVAEILQREIRSERMAAFLSFVLALCMAYAIFPPNMKLPRYDDYREKPLTQIILKNCEGIPDCSFFLFNISMGIIHETAYVTGLVHGSRFPSFWFLPEILKEDKAATDSADMMRLIYADRIAQDLKNYKPRTLIIGRFKREGDDAPFFDFASYWAVSPDFRAQWELYEHTGTQDIAYGDYYPGTLSDVDAPVTYDIYKRQD